MINIWGLESHIKNPVELHIKKKKYCENVFGIGQQNSCYLKREPRKPKAC